MVCLPTRTPGDKTELITVPSMIQPLEIKLFFIEASAPTLTGGRSSDFV